jgi:hypothetical protein
MGVFMKTGTGIQKLIGGGGIHIHTQGDFICLLLFFQNKESRLKNKNYSTMPH